MIKADEDLLAFECKTLTMLIRYCNNTISNNHIYSLPGRIQMLAQLEQASERLQALLEGYE